MVEDVLLQRFTQEEAEEFVCNYAHGSLFVILHAKLYAHSAVSYAARNPSEGIFSGFRDFRI